MKRLICVTVLCVIAPMAAWAQGSTVACTPAAPGAMKGAPSVATDPVSSGLRQVLDCYSHGLIVAAQWVPPDKYTQRILSATVGHNIRHVAFISDFACSKISGIAAPKHAPIASKVDKDSAVAWLKSSMDLCKQAFSKLSDATLEESIRWDGFNPSNPGADSGAMVTRYAAALWVTNVLIERYGAIAGYLQIGVSLSTNYSVPLVALPTNRGSSLKNEDSNRN